jgi:hypothetical protein
VFQKPPKEASCKVGSLGWNFPHGHAGEVVLMVECPFSFWVDFGQAYDYFIGLV